MEVVSEPHRAALLAGLAGALLAAPSPASAYLIDLNDASVVEHGSMALELQPLGYFQTLIGPEDHELVAPSFQLYWGLAEDWDVLYVARGYGLLDPDPDDNAYSFGEQTVAFRTVLRHGTYSSDDADGPAVVFQGGLLLPGIGADPGFGATAALLVSQEWDEGTLHGNVWVNLTRDAAFELFVTAVYEGPSDWDVRPTFEVYFDLYDGEPYVSGLAGAVLDVTDAFALQAGVRLGGWEDSLEMEARLSSWIEWEVFDPTPTPAGSEGDARLRPPTLARAAR